jgi:hypothetical protein
MRVSMAAIIHRADRKFNVDEADGVSRRDNHTPSTCPGVGAVGMIAEFHGAGWAAGPSPFLAKDRRLDRLLALAGRPRSSPPGPRFPTKPWTSTSSIAAHDDSMRRADGIAPHCRGAGVLSPLPFEHPTHVIELSATRRLRQLNGGRHAQTLTARLPGVVAFALRQP